jgi:hypothetical protein
MMTKIWAATTVAGLAVTAVLSIFLVSALREKRVLQAENQRLTQRQDALEQRCEGLTEVTNFLASQWRTTRQAELSNAAVVAQLTAAAETAARVATNVPTPQPYQVQVRLGQKPVGLAWAFPTNVRRDSRTGRVTFEQVVTLPETARGAFTTYVTNTVERVTPPAAPQMVEREVYVPNGPLWPWWPYWAPAHPSRASDPGHGRPPVTQPPAHPSQGGPWTPVTVAPRPAPRPGLFVPPNPGDPGILAPVALR